MWYFKPSAEDPLIKKIIIHALQIIYIIMLLFKEADISCCTKVYIF